MKNQSSQDPLNFPIKINNRLASLLSAVGSGDGKPIGNAAPIFKDLSAELKVQTDKLAQILASGAAGVQRRGEARRRRRHRREVVRCRRAEARHGSCGSDGRLAVVTTAAMPVRGSRHDRRRDRGAIASARRVDRVHVDVSGAPSQVDVTLFGRASSRFRLPTGAGERSSASISIRSRGRTRPRSRRRCRRGRRTRTSPIVVKPKTFRDPHAHGLAGLRQSAASAARADRADSAFLRSLRALRDDRLWTHSFVAPVRIRRTAGSAPAASSTASGATRTRGADFASPLGRPVKAPNGGNVVAARELFFTGNVVIIDHGLGMFSMLAHLSRIDVKEGDEVKAGDVRRARRGHRPRDRTAPALGADGVRRHGSIRSLRLGCSARRRRSERRPASRLSRAGRRRSECYCCRAAVAGHRPDRGDPQRPHRRAGRSRGALVLAPDVALSWNVPRISTRWFCRPFSVSAWPPLSR